MLDEVRTPTLSAQGLVQGAVAGLVATLPMTVVMLVINRLLPRTQRMPLEPYRITNRMAQRLGLSRHLDKKERQAATTVAHFSYGAAIGALYPPLVGRLPLPPLAGGLLFGLAVWAASYLGVIPGLGILNPATKQPAGRNVLLITSHLVWGAVLDLLVRRLAPDETGD